MNRNDELKRCPMCGAPAVIDSTGVQECGGVDWQTLYIECTNGPDKGGWCGMEISVSADFYHFDKNAEDGLIEYWNSFTRDYIPKFSA